MTTTKKFFAAMMALVLIFVPMQVKAAEVAQAEEVQFVELQAETYYKQIDEGLFERYDADGNSISSTKVEDALFKVNATLTEGWGQYKNEGEGKVIEGSFKEATLDTKGYLRCKFTVGSTVYDACVKVRGIKNWATEQKKSAKIAVVKRVTAVTASDQPDKTEPSKPSKPIKPDEDEDPIPDPDPEFPGIIEDEDPGFPGIVE